MYLNTINNKNIAFGFNFDPISAKIKYSQESLSNIVYRNINQSEGGEEGGGEDKNEDDDDDDVDEVVKDTGGESMGEKMKRKLNDEQEYDEDEEDETSSVDEDDEGVNDESVNNPITADDEDDDDIEMKPAIDNDETPTKKKHSKKMNKVRVKRVLGISDLIASYSYDAEDSRWCKIVFKVEREISIFLTSIIAISKTSF